MKEQMKESQVDVIYLDLSKHLTKYLIKDCPKTMWHRVGTTMDSKLDLR